MNIQEQIAKLENDVAEISRILAGPNVGNLERRLLHEDRKDIRRLIEKLKTPGAESDR
jgi:hypothetical protein